jgi:hypothetical protein
VTNTAVDERLIRRSGSHSPAEPAEADVVVPASYFDELEDIAAANRVLASRVAELNAEIERQMDGADRLRERLAVELQRNLAVEARRHRSTTGLLTARIRALPRRAYGRLRRAVRSR